MARDVSRDAMPGDPDQADVLSTQVLPGAEETQIVVLPSAVERQIQRLHHAAESHSQTAAPVPPEETQVVPLSRAASLADVLPSADAGPDQTQIVILPAAESKAESKPSAAESKASAADGKAKATAAESKATEAESKATAAESKADVPAIADESMTGADETQILVSESAVTNIIRVDAPEKKPVFVDPSGRRGRRVRRWAYGIGVLVLLVVAAAWVSQLDGWAKPPAPPNSSVSK